MLSVKDINEQKISNKDEDSYNIHKNSMQRYDKKSFYDILQEMLQEESKKPVEPKEDKMPDKTANKDTEKTFDKKNQILTIDNSSNDNEIGCGDIMTIVLVLFFAIAFCSIFVTICFKITNNGNTEDPIDDLQRQYDYM